MSRGARHGLARPAGALTGGVLAAVAALRGAKAVHPRGSVRTATLRIDGGAAAPPAARLLATPGEHRAVVRLSRSLGLPEPLPDLLGLAIRVLDAYGRGRHQDLLLITSADLPIAHHLFLPAADELQRPYTSSLPYRAGDRTFLIGALPAARDRFDLAVAPVMGRFAAVGRLALGAPLPEEADALRFSPWNTGGGLEPAGVLNRMRDVAYPMSQWAWGHARPGAARAQERAERVVERAA